MKKFNFKLAISLVSLFISIVLILLSKYSKYCFSFAMIFLAVALVLFVADKVAIIGERINQANSYLESDDFNADEIYEVSSQAKKLAKQRISFILGTVVFVILFIVLAFTVSV